MVPWQVASSDAMAEGVPQPFTNRLPEAYMNVPEIIRFRGYPVEEHTVETDDGYLLTLHRIPHGRKGKAQQNEVVILQHGLLSSSADFIINFENQSLGFVLADKGYDVWLANSRGNTYSRKHKWFTTAEHRFWDFSFHEMARFDLPACINYVLKVTNRSSLHYVGHSQGSVIGFIQFGHDLELGKKIKTFVALAPVATVGHVGGVVKLLKYASPYINFMYRLLGGGEFLPSNWLVKLMAEKLCSLPGGRQSCAGVVSLLSGVDSGNLNMTRMPVYIAHTPAGASVKDIVHFVQLMRSNKFRAFDYGHAGNMDRYGQADPLDYTPENVQVETVLYTGSSDILSTADDVNWLRSKLRNNIHEREMPRWNHLDFLWSFKSQEVFLPDLLRILARRKD